MYAFIKFLVRLYFRIMYSLHYEGRDNIPKDTTVIYASNHRSYADPPLVGTGTRGKLSFMAKEELFKKQLSQLAQVHGKVVLLDLRNEETIYAGNRFMIYAMYPETEISVHVAWGFRKQNTAVMIGKSIINKNSKVNIGDLCLSYGGGGHANAGTCQLDNDKVDAELPTIIARLNGEG